MNRTILSTFLLFILGGDVTATPIGEIILCEDCIGQPNAVSASGKPKVLAQILSSRAALVLLVDYSSAQVRHFEVKHEMNRCQGREFLRRASQRRCSARWNVAAREYLPSESEYVEVVDAIRGYRQFGENIREQRAIDLLSGEFRIGSAANLIGSDGGVIYFGSPAYQRRALEMALSDALVSAWRVQLGDQSSSIGARLQAQLIAARKGIHNISVRFPDSTSIDAVVEGVTIDSGQLVAASIKIDPRSAQGPGVPLLPATVSEFMNGPARNGGLVGASRYIRNMAALFKRAGGRVESVDIDGACRASLECSYERDRNEWEPICRMTGIGGSNCWIR